MTDDATPPRTGSRWEPGGPAAGEDETTRSDAGWHEPAPQPTVSDDYAHPDAGLPHAYPAGTSFSAPVAAGGRTPLTRRIPLAVAALAVAVVGGLGGFAIGQAAAGNNNPPAGTHLPQGRGELPDGDRHGFGDRFGPGGRQPDSGNGALPQGPSNGFGTGGGTGTDGA